MQQYVMQYGYMCTPVTLCGHKLHHKVGMLVRAWYEPTNPRVGQLFCTPRWRHYRGIPGDGRNGKLSSRAI